jgi:hypothetical protein
VVFRLLILVAVIGIIALAIRAFRQSKDDPKRRRQDLEQKIAPLHAELLSLCHDERVAESLVEAEMLQNPQFSEAQCYRRAIKKLKYDRTR